MGAGSSAPKSKEEKIFYAERDTPINFAPNLIQQLADSSESPIPNEGRQRLLDEHIKQRIEREIAQLKRDEAEVQHEIQRTLERENAEKEKEVPGGLDSKQVEQDLEGVRHKIERQRRRKDGIEEQVGPKRSAVVACYQANPKRTLDCWREVEDFKAVVREVEQEFLKGER